MCNIVWAVSLGAIVLTAVVYGDSDDPTKEMIGLARNVFNSYPQDKKGSISTDNVGPILERLGHPEDGDRLSDVISELDPDGSGEMEFEAFLSLLSKVIIDNDSEAMQQSLEEMFRLHDQEGNGSITTSAMRDILKELDHESSNEEMDAMIKDIDSDGSGTITFDEFMDGMAE